MPAIDHHGKWHVKARSNTTAAIGFPISAARLSTARRFAERMVLELLPGWVRGRLWLTRNRKPAVSWVLHRQTTDAPGREPGERKPPANARRRGRRGF